MPIALALPPLDPGSKSSCRPAASRKALSDRPPSSWFRASSSGLAKYADGRSVEDIDAPSAKGVAAFFVKLNHKAGKGQIDAGMAYRVRTGLKASADAEAWEFMVGARRDFGPFAVRANAEI